MTETIERTTLADFIAQHKITATAEWAAGNPNMPDSDYMTRHFKVTLRHGRRTMTVPFSQGSAHTDEPTAADVLDGLASDASGYENARSFEDWAAEYGYDTDSRKAEKTYKAVERATAKLQQFLGDADEAYEQLLWHTERE